jgi:hypothetical protein
MILGALVVLAAVHARNFPHRVGAANNQAVPIDTAIPDCATGPSNCFQQTWNNMVICSNNPKWNNGTGTFRDQIGAGTITAVDVSLIGQSFCNAPGHYSIDFYLNGALLGTYSTDASNPNCRCQNPCDLSPPFVSKPTPTPPPYFFNGLNELTVAVNDDPGLYGCYGGYQLSLTYIPATPVPTPPPTPSPSPSPTPTLIPTPSPSATGFTCCIFEDIPDQVFKSFCSPNPKCPTVSGFSLIERFGVYDCSDCNAFPTCCFYENATSPVNTTTRCTAPLQTCPSVSGFVSIGQAPVSDCSYCVFNRRREE